MKNLREMTEKLHLEGVNIVVERKRIANHLANVHEMMDRDLSLGQAWKEEQNIHEMSHVDVTIQGYPNLGVEAKKFMKDGVNIKSVWGHEDDQPTWSTIVDIPREVLILEPEYGLEVAKAPLSVGGKMSKEDSTGMMLCLGIMLRDVPWGTSTEYVPAGETKGRILWQKEAEPLVVTQEDIAKVVRRRPYINPGTWE